MRKIISPELAALYASEMIDMSNDQPIEIARNPPGIMPIENYKLAERERARDRGYIITPGEKRKQFKRVKK